MVPLLRQSVYSRLAGLWLVPSTGVNVGQSELGVFTKRPGRLTNDFFVSLLDMNTEWQASSTSEDVFEGRDRRTGDPKWNSTRVDLAFSSNSERSRKSTHVTTRSRRSCVTSWLRGTR